MALGRDLTRRLGALILVGAVAASYQPALHGGFVWDDDSNVTGNDTLRDGAGLRRIWTDPTANQQNYPLTYTSFWVERRLWGLDPRGYHAVNIALHAGSALLLWRLLLSLGVPGAWLAAAIFALHPLQAESVAWITERKNTLSALFFLGSALAGLRFWGLGSGGALEGEPALAVSRRWRWYALCSGLFACALLAKTVTCLLPVVLGLLIWWKRGRSTARDLLPLLPLTLLGAAAGLRTAWLEQRHVGAVGPDFSHTLIEKTLIAGRAAWFYLGKLAFPADLSFIYPQWRVESGDAAAYLYPAAALATAAGLWMLRRRIGRGPLAAALYYAVMIFPALGFFNLYFMRYSFVQDHFQYLAGIGPIALFGAGVARAQAAVLGRGAEGSRVPAAGVAAPVLFVATAILILVPLAALTRQRSAVFRDQETLWRDTLAENPAAWMAHNNLGVIIRERGRLAEAEAHFRAALTLRPDLAETWVNLGDALLAGDSVPEARDAYLRAVELEPALPSAHVGLGAAFDREGQAAAAEQQFRKALMLHPANTDARYYLARISLRRGETAAAAAQLEGLLEDKPSLAKAHTLYGDVLAAQGREHEAQSRYREAIRLSPERPEGHLALGALLAARGDLVAAAASFSRAVAVKPDFAEAHYNLGKVLDLEGKTQEAVERYRLAIAAKPDFTEAHNNLGVDLLLLGDAEAGVAHLQEALRLRPDYREARVNLERHRGR